MLSYATVCFHGRCDEDDDCKEEPSIDRNLTFQCCLHHEAPPFLNRYYLSKEKMEQMLCLASIEKLACRAATARYLVADTSKSRMKHLRRAPHAQHGSQVHREVVFAYWRHS